MRDFKVRYLTSFGIIVWCDIETGYLLKAVFPGTSAIALDVIAGVTSEYLLNVGRTLRFLCDKYAKSMTPEVRLLFLEIFVCSLPGTGNHSAYTL